MSPITAPIQGNMPSLSIILIAILLIAGIFGAFIFLIWIIAIKLPLHQQKEKTNMKLQCKVCGSYNLTKKNNSIICDECGCKYSINETQNIINEKTSEKSNPISNTNDSKWKVSAIILSIILIITILLISIQSLNLTTKDKTIKNPNTEETISLSTIPINTNNFTTYCNIKYEIIPQDYDMNLLNPGYQKVTIKVTTKGVSSNYEFNNTQMDIFLEVKFNEIRKSLFNTEILPIEVNENKTIQLNIAGESTTIFEYYTVRGKGVIEDTQEINVVCRYGNVSGELKPLK